MAGPETDLPGGEAPRAAPAKKRRRWLRRMLWTAGIGLVLLLSLYLLRQPLFGGMIRAELAAALGTALGAEVEVGPLGGNWLTHIEVESVNLRGDEDSAWRRIQDLSLEVHLSPWQLASGELGGLEQLQVRGKKLQLDLQKPLLQPSPEPAAAPTGPAPSLASLLRLLGSGAGLQIEELDLQPSYLSPGTLSLSLAPATGTRRSLEIRAPGLELSAEIAQDGQLEAKVIGSALGKLLRAAGVLPDAPDQGALQLSVTGNISPLQLALEVRADARSGDGRPLRLALSAGYSQTGVRVPELSFVLPGIEVQARDFNLPMADGGLSLVALQKQGRGSFSLQIDDLSSWINQLPPESRQAVATRMPVRGKLQVELGDSALNIAPSRFDFAGGHLQLDAGRVPIADLPLDGELVRAVRAEELGLELRLDESFRHPIDPERHVAVRGRIQARLSGQLLDPNAQLDIDLADLRLPLDATGDHLVLERLKTRVDYQQRTLRCQSLELRDLRRKDRKAAARLAGSATLRLGEDFAPEELEAQLDGALPAATLALFDKSPGRLADADLQLATRMRLDTGAAWPSGELTCKLRRLGYPGIGSHDLELRARRPAEGAVLVETCTIQGPEIQVELGGSITQAMQLDLQGKAAVQGLERLCKAFELPELRGGAELGRIRIKDYLLTPTWDLHASARLTHIAPELLAPAQRSHWQDAPLQLDLELAGAPAGALDLNHIELRRCELNWGTEAARHLVLKASGTLPLALVINDETWRAFAVQPTEPLSLRIQATVDQLAASVPPVELDTRLTLAQKGPLLQLTARSPQGSLECKDLQVELDYAQALSRQAQVDWLALPLRGALILHEYRLGSLLNKLQKGLRLEGTGEGSIRFDGRVYRPNLDGGIQLQAASLSTPALPQIQGLRMDLKLSDHRLEIVTRGADTRPEAPQLLVDLAAGDAKKGWEGVTEAGVKGQVRLRNFDLRMLPATRHLESSQGMLDLELDAGAVFRLATDQERFSPQDLRLLLTLRDGACKFRGSPPLQDVQLRIEGDAKGLRIRSAQARFQEQQIRLEGEAQCVGGDVWAMLDAERRAKQQLAGRLDVPDFPLDVLPRQLTGLGDLQGRFDLNAELAGTLSDLHPKLSCKFEKAAVKAPGLPRVADIAGLVELDAAGARLNIQATMGAAPLEVDLDYKAGPGAFPKSFASAYKVDGHIKGSEVLLIRSGGLKIRGDLDIHANGSDKGIEVSGQVNLADSKFVKRLSLVPDMKMRGGAGGGAVFGPWGFPGGELFHFDVGVKSKKNFVIRANIVDTDLDVNCRLVGNGNALHLAGVCSAKSGTIRFPGMGLQINSLRLAFPEANPTRPDILVAGRGQRHGFRITMRCNGPWDDPTIALTSTPALQPKELWTLVSTGQRPQTLRNNDAQSNTAILATYVLQELLLTYFASESTEEGESWVSRFTFEFGSEISKNGQETWEVDFNVGELWSIPENFGLRFERDVYEDLNLGVFYRWRF